MLVNCVAFKSFPVTSEIIMLQQSDGVLFFIYFTLVFVGTVSIERPILNLTGMSHPGEICRCLDEERKNSQNNEGLYSRFLLSMPEPVFHFADEVECLRPDFPTLDRYDEVIWFRGNTVRLHIRN